MGKSGSVRLLPRRNEAQMGYSACSYPDLLDDFPGFGNGLLECQGMSRIAKGCKAILPQRCR